MPAVIGVVTSMKVLQLLLHSTRTRLFYSFGQAASILLQDLLTVFGTGVRLSLRRQINPVGELTDV
jgi:hypothetical protein